MKNLALFMVLFAVLAVISSGCGGSSDSTPAPEESSSQASTTHLAADTLDSDGDGIADIFGYSAESSANFSRNAAGIVQLDVPFVKYVHDYDLDDEGRFTALVDLEAGTEYVFKYSRSGRLLDDKMLDSYIITPDGQVMSFTYSLAPVSEDAADSSSESEEVESHDASITSPEETHAQENLPSEVMVDAVLAILPPENPCEIMTVFTAPQAGTYTFTLREVELEAWLKSNDVTASDTDSDDNAPAVYQFQIYKKADEKVYTIGKTQSVMTSRDVLDIQRMLLDNAESFNNDGLPIKFTQEFEESGAYAGLIEEKTANYEIAADDGVSASSLFASSSGASINSVEYDVPYDEEFSPGRGFYADNGLAAINEGAVNFTVPTPTTGKTLAFKTSYSSKIVSTEEEHDRELELQSMSTFCLVKNALGIRPITATNTRLGQISKSLVVRYDIMEIEPRNIDVSTLKLTNDARDVLNQGSDVFREEYGDYFVSGYTWGMRYEAVISVTAQSTSEVDKIISLIKSYMDISSQGIVTQFANIGSTSSSTIDVELIQVYGGAPSKKYVIISNNILDITSGLREFVIANRNPSKSNCVKLKTTLTRFREIPEAKSKISSTLPVSQSDFNDIRDLVKSIFRARSYYNSVMGIPTNNILDGQSMRDGWKREFEGAIDEVKLSLNQICRSNYSVRNYTSSFNNFATKYREFGERYIFYQELKNAQNNQGWGWSNSDAHDYWTSYGWGIKDYNKSSVVASDYESGLHCDWGYSHGANMIHYYTWTVWCDQSNNNYRHAWVSVWHKNTNCSDCKDQSHPAVGSHKSKWYFEGGTWRRIEVWYQDKLIYMPSWKYPFTGLSD